MIDTVAPLNPKRLPRLNIFDTEAEAVALANDELDAMVTPVIGSPQDMTELMATEQPLAPDTSAQERADRGYAWLQANLTPQKVAELLPEAADLPIDVHLLPNLHAVNVVIHGLLGRGVSDSTRLDPQAKGLAEQLRARLVELPTELLDTP